MTRTNTTIKFDGETIGSGFFQEGPDVFLNLNIFCPLCGIENPSHIKSDWFHCKFCGGFYAELVGTE